METKELAIITAHYYDFVTTCLDFITKQEKKHTIEDDCYLTCFNGFLLCLKNYLLLVYDDISSIENPLLPKSNVNKVLVRNAVEAILILDIFKSKPELISKYYDTYLSDKKRIHSLYKPSAAEGEKFLRRFSWLPRIKGKRANSLVDLLNYVEFEDEEQKDIYRILIRNLDNFIHPSFHIGQSIENKSIGNIDTIGALFLPDGFLYELSSNLASYLKEYYSDFEEEQTIKLLDLDSITSKTIADDCLKIKKCIPNEANLISYSIAQLSNYLVRISPNTYRQQNLRYLLVDLAPRLDDLLKSFYMKNSLLFEIEVRTIIESLSMMHTIMKEDERRNYIFYIHQQIKGYEAYKSASDLITQVGLTLSDNQFEQDYLTNIEIIRTYYQSVFNKEVDTRDILRLNGWAMYLKAFNNNTVPNAALIIDNLFKDFFPPEYENYFNSYFEESNTYTHITLYAFKDGIYKEIPKLVVLNLVAILTHIVAGIVRSLQIESVLSKEESDSLAIDFFEASEQLNKIIKDK